MKNGATTLEGMHSPRNRLSVALLLFLLLLLLLLVSLLLLLLLPLLLLLLSPMHTAEKFSLACTRAS